MKTKILQFIWLIFLLTFSLPIALTALIAFSSDSFLTLPTEKWSTRWFFEFFQNSRWIEAFKQSFFISTISTFLGLSIGIATAYSITKSNMRFKFIVHWMILFPMLIPQIVLGIGSTPLLYFLEIQESAIPLIIANTLIISPVIYLILKKSLENLAPELDEAATGLGANSYEVFYKITVPLLLPHIIVSGIIAFTISINESIVSIFLTCQGNETIPSICWSQLKHAPSPMIAVASVLNFLIIMAIACLNLTISKITRYLP